MQNQTDSIYHEERCWMFDSGKLLENAFDFCIQSLEFSQVKGVLLQEFFLQVQGQQALKRRLRKQHYIIAT